MNRVLLAALAVATGGCAAAAATESALDRIRARGELTWGADEQGGEPYVYEDPARGGALVGFEVDLADALARALGVRARFVQNDWTTLIPSLERGTFDIAMNGIEVTPALRGARRVLAPVLPVHRAAGRAPRATRASAISRRSRGLRVGTLAEQPGVVRWRRDAGADAVPYDGVDEPFVDLAHERIDAVLLDDIIVARYARRHPSLVVVGDVAEGATRSRCAAADRELRGGDRSRARRTLIASGAWRQMLARWQLDSARQAALAVAPAARRRRRRTAPRRCRRGSCCCSCRARW